MKALSVKTNHDYPTQGYNTPNFTAKLDVSELNKNVRRWKNIAKAFEARTANNYIDSIALIDNGKGSFEVSYSFEKGIGFSFCKLGKNQMATLLKNPDDMIAGTFSRLLAIYKFQCKKIGYAKEFLNKVEHDGGADVEFVNSLWTLVINKCASGVQNMLNKDPMLRLFKNP